MAKDMVCKLCESEPEQEVGIMLISDLTGSGQLPFAIGPRCIEAWLTEMLEVFALPEGIPPSEPSELEEDEVEMTAGASAEAVALLDQDDDIAEAYPSAADEGLGDFLGEPEEDSVGDDSEDPLATTEALETNTGISTTPGSTEGPTAILEPPGPSPAGSSAPSTGNGRRGARKLTDPVNIPTA